MRTGSIFVAALAFGLSLSACVDDSGADGSEAESGDATSDSSTGDASASSSETDSGSDASSSDTSDASTDTSDASTDTGDTSDTTDGPPCDYPAGAVEPMALGEVLTPYAWPEAIRADGLTTPLALENAACDDDAVIDWTPRDVIVFISWPAW